MIKLIKPYINFDEVKDEFEEIFESGWFTKGKYVEQFREGIKSYTGAKHAYLTTSATTALTMGLKLVGIKEGDEVIVSDFSYPSYRQCSRRYRSYPHFFRCVTRNLQYASGRNGG